MNALLTSMVVLALAAGKCLGATPGASPEEINVALQALGSRAAASSSYGPGYDASRAIDEKWENRETDKWNSAAGSGPHWVVVDFGRVWKIHKAVIRHEGVFGGGNLYNTRNFQIQRGQSKDGPWTDLVPPIVGNAKDITTHVFAPQAIRFLRVFITQGEQRGNEYGRIYEIEAYADAADAPASLRSKFAALREGEFLTLPACFSNGEVRIVSSSHQDTAWMNTQDYCRRYRIEHVLLPALEMMRQDPHYAFSMEGTLHLMELMDAHPELRDEVASRMREGRLEFGATYNEPYESWLSGEELVREVYFGRRWIHKNFPGCDAKVEFNPDPPGRALQMQQILNKAGVPYLFISRFHSGLHQWFSPDGSSALAYSPGHYGNDLDILDAPFPKAIRATGARLDELAPDCGARRIPPECCLINSMDFTQPRDFSSLMDAWNAQPRKAGDPSPPRMRYSTLRGFFDAASQPGASFDAIQGERPDIWVYITGPAHEQMDSAKREAARLLPAAEMFTVFAGLVNSNFAAWPSNEFNNAWMDELYPDHGLGGKDGQISDAVFLQKVQSARDTGRRLLDRALAEIASKVSPGAGAGIPVVVFNDLPWERSGETEILLPPSMTDSVAVVDAGGNEIPSQFSNLGLTDEMNVAQAALGAKASASSVFGPRYEAANVIGGSALDEWRPAANNKGPAWLSIDFGQPRAIHKVVISHEGVLGVFGDERRQNTADFEIQGAMTPMGPWADLVPPIVGNRASLTTHSFAAKTIRCVRLLIQRGSQPKGDRGARICQVQAFARQEHPRRKIVFVASNVPSLGCKTYRLAARPASAGMAAAAGAAECENEFYRVTLAPGGIRGLFDKQLGRNLLNTSKFLGGEVFTMTSVAETNRELGTDAGEFVSVPLPVMDSTFDRVSNYKPSWKLLEHGPVRTVYGLEQPLRDTTVRQRVVIWNQIKRVDCEVDLDEFNGELWREFRMALPPAMEHPKLVYEVPMGTVEIGRDEIPTNGGLANDRLNYSQPSRDIHPRQVQNFIDASDALGGLTMSSSVSVFDWVDPAARIPGAPILQPVLLASRKSCNSAGVWYPQAGSHSFRFPITSHSGDWRNGWRDGIAANHPLLAVLPAGESLGGLPAEISFASVTGSHVMLTAIKKAEDGDGVAVRACEMEGKDGPAVLRMFRPLKSAARTSIIEEDARPAEVADGCLSLQGGHHAIETYCLQF
ncbi:MAG TPA: discoidin domain-containing protein [Verrucomicrobiae bacterium]|jgi:hypothetical protein